MLSSDKSSSAVVKVVDFGSASVTDSNEDQGMTAATPAYTPPEYLSREGKDNRPVDPSFDMWALGVIVYIMLTGA